MLACVSMIVVSILEIPNLHDLVAVQSEKQQHLDVDSIICDKFLTFFFLLFCFTWLLIDQCKTLRMSYQQEP